MRTWLIITRRSGDADGGEIAFVLKSNGATRRPPLERRTLDSKGIPAPRTTPRVKIAQGNGIVNWLVRSKTERALSSLFQHRRSKRGHSPYGRPGFGLKTLASIPTTTHQSEPLVGGSELGADLS